MVRNKWAEELIKANSVIYEKPVELRSEKVRNIIGQVPPVLLRYGISIIGLSLLVLVGISAFIPYQPRIETEITITQDKDGLLHYTADIQSTNNKQSQFSEIIAETASEFSLPTHYQIQSISDTVTLSGQKAWRTAILNPVNATPQNIKLENPVTVQAKIMQEKQSVLMWVTGRP